MPQATSRTEPDLSSLATRRLARSPMEKKMGAKRSYLLESFEYSSGVHSIREALLSMTSALTLMDAAEAQPADGTIGFADDVRLSGLIGAIQDDEAVIFAKRNGEWGRRGRGG